MIEVGCLVRNATTVDYPVIWVVLDEIADSVLLASQKTNYKMWAEKSQFVVVV